MRRNYETPEAGRLYARNALLVELYATAKKYLEHRCNQIIEKNNTLNCCGEVGGKVYYQGRIFQSFVPGLKPISGPPGFDLHPSLEEEMNCYLIESKRLDKELEETSLFLSWFFAEVTNPTDINELLGDNLYQVTKPWVHRWMSENPLEEGEMQMMVKKTRDSIEIMKQRQLDNILASQLYGE